MVIQCCGLCGERPGVGVVGRRVVFVVETGWCYSAVVCVVRVFEVG